LSVTDKLQMYKMQVKKKHWIKFLAEFNRHLSNAFAISISVCDPYSTQKMQSLDERYMTFKTKCIVTSIKNVDITIVERKYDGYHLTSW
jgi:hypothetical protein